MEINRRVTVYSEIRLNHVLMFTIVYILMFLALIGIDNSVIGLIILLVIFSATVFGLHIKGERTEIVLNYLILLILQNTLLGIGSVFFPMETYENLSYYTMIPMIFILIYCAVIMVTNKAVKVNSTLLFALLNIIYIMINFSLSSVGFMAKAIYLRNYIFFILCVYVGYKTINSKKRFVVFTKWCTIIVVIASIIGFFEYLFYTNDVWKNLMGTEYIYIAKKSIRINDGIPNRWYTGLFGLRFFRYPSLYREPINYAHLISGTLLLSLNIKWAKSIITMNIVNIFLFTVLLLTVGKGGTIIFICTQLLVYYYSNKSNKFIVNSLPKVLLWSLTLTTFGGYLYVTVLFRYIGGYALPHLEGIINAFENNSIFGKGLGTSGNLGIFTKANKVTESAIGVYMDQLGVIGLIILCVLIVSVMKKLFLRYQNNNRIDTKLCTLGIVLIFWVFAMAWFQENVLTPQCISLYSIIIGGCLGATGLKVEEDVL